MECILAKVAKASLNEQSEKNCPMLVEKIETVSLTRDREIDANIAGICFDPNYFCFVYNLTLVVCKMTHIFCYKRTRACFFSVMDLKLIN